MITARGGAIQAAGTKTITSPASGDFACLKSALALPDTASRDHGEARLTRPMEDLLPDRPAYAPPRSVHALRAAASFDSNSSAFAVMKVAVSPPAAALPAQQGPAQ